MAPKGRLGNSKGFGSPALSSFGGFSTPSTSVGSLSYLSDPPDLSSISDPNVVVSFKNLLKKDNTTKSKALADLVTYTQAHPHEQDGGVEDAVLDAWVQLYARISIDNDRRVRELSHTLQLKLLQSARKRMEKRIPKVAGVWLAGSFDRDKPVAKATTEGLSAVFTTEEKVTQFWRKCQLQILQYATEAITETPDTLSDERSTKPEDAETKYYRAIAGGFALVLGLLQRLSQEDTKKFASDYEAFFSSGPGESTWSFATADDSRVRKIVYQLLRLCLEKHQALLDPHMPRVIKIITLDTLKKPQLGSADELVGVLIELTRFNGELWGSKRSPLSKLRGFVEKGSQGGRPSFWDGLDKLLAALPTGSISEEAVSDFFRSFRTGISRREEPRTNAPYAWKCYLNAASRLLDQADPEFRVKFVAETVFPLTDKYLFSPERHGEWLTGVQVSVLSQAYSVAALSADTQVRESLSKEWERLGVALITRLSTSLPEVSKEFQTSQNKIAEDGKRWFSVVGAIHTSSTAPSGRSQEQQEQRTKDYTESAASTVVREAADLLKRRNFKPFGAAAILLWALKQSPYLFTAESQGLFASVIPMGSGEEMARLLSSPSAPYIISCIEAWGQNHHGGFEDIWSTTIQSLLQVQGENSQAGSYLTKLISIPAVKPMARNSIDLQQHLEKNILACSQSRDGSWDMVDATLVGDLMPETSLRSLASNIIETLDSESGMKAIEIILRRRPTIISEDETLHLKLTTKLLALMEISEPAHSSRASQLRSLLEKHGDAQPSILSIIQENLERPGPDSLSIETLVQQATATLEGGNIDLGQMLPDTKVWANELSCFLQGEINPSLALTSNVSSACFLSKGNLLVSSTSLPRDSRGLSIPARMAMYTTAMFDHGIQLEALSQDFQAELLYLLYLVIELASDQMSLMDSNTLFQSLEEPNLLREVEDFVASTRKTMNDIFAKFQGWRPGAQQSLLDELVGILIKQARALVPAGIYSARALSEIFEAFSDAHGHASAIEEWVLQLDIMKASHATVLPSTAFLTGYGEMLAGSKAVSTLLNRLISDIAGANPQAEKTLQTLVLLNACMPIFELGRLPVANNRLVFAVKQITSWFAHGPEDLGMEVATESCRALQRLFPCVQEVYGPYWEQAIGFCLSLWNHASKDDPDRRLPSIHASVKLLSALRQFDEPNDDLIDAIDMHADSTYHALLNLLKLPGRTNSQPQEIVDSLLCREAANIPTEHLKDLTDIYGLVASESRDIQTAGFNLIHRALPAAQEQVSLDVLLEKKQARLPDELTSLLLDAPTLEAFPEEVLVQFPTPIRSYLLSWKLVFAAYEGAAYKVRTDYTEDLKVNGTVGPLMEFMFDVLGHSAASPINLDKEGLTVDDIQEYDVKVADSLPEEKNMHWLLIHLFYLTLKFVPGLFKTWFLDCRSKQTRIAIEPWMIKYFSPIIIHDAIAEVQKWSNSQDVSDPDEKELAIKVNYAQREITAAYAIDDGGDEQSASMLIRIKPNYPLDFVDVVGLNRVACSERTWQSWLRITQGIITISNGAIIDGLSTFRRNVLGALKGHVECAICYSFIAVDRKMPDKKCATCKNLFHRDCLFKWFSSANQNTCPLCRTRMDFVDKKKVSKSLRRPPVDGD